LLRSGRIESQPVDGGPPSGEINRLPAEQARDELKRLVGAGAALVSGHGGGREFGRVFAADSDAEVEAAARHLVERGDELGRQHRRVNRQDRQRAEQPDPLGGTRSGSEHHKRIRGATVKEEVLTAREEVEPAVLGPTRHCGHLPLIAGQDDSGTQPKPSSYKSLNYNTNYGRPPDLV
jgi:hypothetical protein